MSNSSITDFHIVQSSHMFYATNALANENGCIYAEGLKITSTTTKFYKWIKD